MIHYILVTSLLTVLVLVTYKVFLENIKANQLKRGYLLLALPIIFITPLIEFPTAIPTLTTASVFTETLDTLALTEIQLTQTPDTSYLNLGVLILYLAGVFFMLVRLTKQLYTIHFIKKTGSMYKEGNQRFVYNYLIQSPFSFFSIIFLPLHHSFDPSNKIIQHELIHVKQRHSYDIMLIEVIKVLFWFNPLYYYYKNHIALNHEFLADEQNFNSKEEQQSYLQLLLSEIELSTPTSFVSTFNFNQTKKRFIMITQQKNKKRTRLMCFTAAIFLTTTGLFSISCTSKNNKEAIVEEQETTTPTSEEVMTAVEKQAKYPGGMIEFNNDFIELLKLSEEDFETFGDQESIRIIPQFVVTKTGTLDQINIVRGQEYAEISAKVIAVLEKMPKWEPATHQGKIVASHFTLPITIKKE